ncbi:hypothetical protein HXX76_002773 [Chlamydomonas incerta]|uniref:Mur ligase central domain-containing protein n=1 Tax=Chlamydomonas incerta TaxID=51695 RepID=A0A835W7U3_CHLIN|nr:hypothetical protein HXX76_002773 [Chlamydomonas incerta]|eukprot:KAG2442690.1 hypothetical protein HXX76_002773 [Chlamydomonas incerta]
MGTPRLPTTQRLTGFWAGASASARACASCVRYAAAHGSTPCSAWSWQDCFSGAQRPNCAAGVPAASTQRRSFAASAAGGGGSGDDASPSTSAAAMLDDLVNGVNYERSGIPAAAGTDASSRFDLGRMRRLLEALGSPHLALKAVHVAGSKGKGSTVAMLASCFAAAGYRAGVYTSPHLLALEERIAVALPGGGGGGGGGGGRPRPIPADDLAFLLARHGDAIRARVAAEGPGGPGALSHFELTTALAFRYFADCGVDVAVVETGLGGVTDATNVFPAANLQAAVITGLGLEHVEALGGSLRSIATAKAGIARPGRPLVLGPQPHAEAEQVVLAEAARLGAAPVVRAEQSVRVHSHGVVLDAAAPPGSQAVRERLTLELLPDPSSGSSSSSSSSSSSGSSSGINNGSRTLDVTVGLVGPHQAANVATAVAAARVLRGPAGGGWALPDEALAAGLAAAHLPGRFQVLQLPGGGPYVVLDGAHTAESAAALVASLRAAFPLQPQQPAAASSSDSSSPSSSSPSTSSSSSCPVALVLAMADDKDHRAVVGALRGLAPKVAVFTSVPIAGSSRRAAAPGTLAGHWQAAAILAPASSRPFRCRELVQASLGAAFAKAAAELRAWRVQMQGGGGAGGGGGGAAAAPALHPGVIVVTGSLHAVAEAHKLPELAPLLVG